MNMKLLAVVTQPSIYLGCSTRKTFWEEKFTGEEKLFSAVNIKNCGCCNVRKHREIRGSDRYITLDISLKFDSLDKMKITSSESKEKLERSGAGLITSLVFKAKVRQHKYKKAKYDIGNVSKKYLSKIIREFDKFKHDPTESYFYLARHLVKCIMRDNDLNWHGYGSYTEITAPYLNVYSTDKNKSKRINVHETLSQSCSANKDESK